MTQGPGVAFGRVVALHEGPAGLLGRVSVKGALLELSFDLLREASVGDTVLFHAGVALARVREEACERGGDREQEG